VACPGAIEPQGHETRKFRIWNVHNIIGTVLIAETFFLAEG